MENWKLTYSFTEKMLQVYRNDELFEKVNSYQKISSIYTDEKNFYLGVNNEDLYILPKRDFKTGTTEDFLEFITTKSHVDAVYLPAKQLNQFKQMISIKR